MAALLLVGCSGEEAWLDAVAPAADTTATVTWVLLGMGGAVYVAVMVLALMGLRRARRPDDGDPASEVDDPPVARRLVVVAGLVLPAIVLLVLNVVTVPMSASVGAWHEQDGELVVNVNAEQFWWRVTYPDLQIETANEINVPTGTTVRLRITSADVIHSFWVPRLAGKVDATPGHITEQVLEVDEAGRYTGRCTEYCGLAHAQMRIHVVAQDPADFRAWTRAQQQPRPRPADEGDQIAAGREVFLSSSCVYCHTVRGHGPPNAIGPDLTHLASRETIAGGILDNDRATLGGWVVDPQSLKPGTRMPGTQLSGDELRDLVEYLVSLE